MQKKFILLALLLHQLLAAQNSAGVYQELSDPAPTDAAAWKALKSAVSVSFANGDVRYAKHQLPGLTPQLSWDAVAWKGEKINTQVLVWTTKALPRIRIERGDLVGPKGARIGRRHIQANFVRYVMSDLFESGCRKHVIQQGDSLLVAEVLDIVPTLPLDASAVQPIWISVTVPAGVPAGTYKGNLFLYADKKYSLKVVVKVLPHTLPPVRDWAFDLDFWQHPAAIARVHGVPLWTVLTVDLIRQLFLIYFKINTRLIAKNFSEPFYVITRPGVVHFAVGAKFGRHQVVG